MTTALAVAKPSAVELIQNTWDEEDQKLIKQICAPKDVSPSEFKMLLYRAAQYDLNPLNREIWCVRYDPAQPVSIFAGRDGLLTIAHRTGQFAGINTETIYDAKGAITYSRTTIWRKDSDHPFIVQVKFSEYDTKKSSWLKRPETMINKVSDSQCLRKAFNISGIYDQAEFDRNAVVEGEAHEVEIMAPKALAQQPTRPPVAQAAIDRYEAKQQKPIMQSGEYVDWLSTVIGVDVRKDTAVAKQIQAKYNQPDNASWLKTLKGKVSDPYREMLRLSIKILPDIVPGFDWGWDSATGLPDRLQETPFGPAVVTEVEAEEIPLEEIAF